MVRIFSALPFLALAAAAPAQFAYPTFAGATGLTLNGPAAISGDVLRLNPAARQQVGGALRSDLQDVSRGFATTFGFRITDRVNSGGDGIAFIAGTTDPKFVGTDPGTGLSVYLDTYNNGDEGSASQNNLRVFVDGHNVRNVALQSDGLGAIDDGTVHTLGLNLGATGTLVAVLDGSAVLTQTGLAPLSATGYVGFGSYSGEAFETQDVTTWAFTPQAAPEPPALAALGLGALGLLRRRR